jgi:hypothetical protein
MRGLEQRLLSLLRERGVEGAMAELERTAQADPAVRRDGHVYAHAIGLAAYTTPAEVGATFARCTPSFQSGCYHGVIQSYFVDPRGGGGAEGVTAERVNALCADHRGGDADHWLLFQCAHGMGHGLTMVSGYHLPRSLQGCDLLTDAWERDACYGGVFMENIVQATSPHHGVGRPQHAAAAGDADEHAHHAGHEAAAPAPDFKPLDPADPLYPCSVLDERYLSACYQMQTSAVLHFNGGDMAAAARTCDRAPERYRATCYQSLGRDVSSYTGQRHAAAVRLCSLGEARYRPWCHVGYAKNLIDLTARPDQALAYCRAVPDAGGKAACYRAVGEQLWVLERDLTRRAALCAQAEPEHRGACRRGAALRDETLGGA